MPDQLGGYLRDLRHARRLSTRQLAKLAECSQTLVTLVEIGERTPSLDKLWRIVKALEGNFRQAVYLLCLDSGVPEEIAREVVGRGKEE